MSFLSMAVGLLRLLMTVHASEFFSTTSCGLGFICSTFFQIVLPSEFSAPLYCPGSVPEKS
jgi:hypothetical protein